MSDEQKQILREHFLEAFVRELIMNSYDPSKDKELQKELEQKEMLKIRSQLENTTGMPMLNSSMPQPLVQPPQNFPVASQQFSQGFQIPQGYQSIPTVNAIPLPKEMYHAPSKPGQRPETINLGKLASMLVDPAVVSVECPGPYKNILVNRSGIMQTSGVTLTPEEIEAIMQNVSEKTRIPLTGGVFKAAVQDLLVTAVISDFVGTRFLIQKRSPFQRY